MPPRFKIDVNDYHSESHPFALYRRKVDINWLGSVTERWSRISSFKTTEDAHAYYKTIKNLPEYLD